MECSSPPSDTQTGENFPHNRHRLNTRPCRPLAAGLSRPLPRGGGHDRRAHRRGQRRADHALQAVSCAGGLHVGGPPGYHGGVRTCPVSRPSPASRSRRAAYGIASSSSSAAARQHVEQVQLDRDGAAVADHRIASRDSMARHSHYPVNKYLGGRCLLRRAGHDWRRLRHDSPAGQPTPTRAVPILELGVCLRFEDTRRHLAGVRVDMLVRGQRIIEELRLHGYAVTIRQTGQLVTRQTRSRAQGRRRARNLRSRLGTGPDKERSQRCPQGEGSLVTRTRAPGCPALCAVAVSATRSLRNPAERWPASRPGRRVLREPLHAGTSAALHGLMGNRSVPGRGLIQPQAGVSSALSRVPTWKREDHLTRDSWELGCRTTITPLAPVLDGSV